MSADGPVRLSIASLVCIAGGLLTFCAFPPVELWPLAFVGPALLFWSVRGVGPARGALLGFVFGLAFYGSTLYWILLFGELAWGALTLLCAASTALVGALAPAMLRPGHPYLSSLGLAASWTLVDFVRSHVPFGGFTWGALGISQADDRLLLPLATVAGVWGLTFVVSFVAALLVEAVAGGGGGRPRITRLLVALVVAAAPVLIPFAGATGPEVDIAALQIDVRVGDDVPAGEEDLVVARRHLELHDELADDPPDLALWGEGALDPFAAADPATVESIRASVSAVGAPTAIGAVLRDPDGSEHTSVLLLDGSGEVVDRYDKTHLVPFGEYVPFRERLDWIDAIDQIPVDRVPGEDVVIFRAEGVPAFATPICFENAFPEITREAVRSGATFLVVPVNNASYGFTAASDQHLQMSRIRAVETGRWVVDAAVSGVTAFIGPDGRVEARTGLFETGILRRQIRASMEHTLYVRLGDWAPLVCLVIVMGSLIAPRRRSAARPRPEALVGTPRTLVILPTYDERATIERVISGILPHGVDVMVVDDSSPDGTAEIVGEIASRQPRVRLIRRPAKAGLASAYLEGFRTALAEGYDLIVEMDSDLSHDPAELPAILAAANEGHDLVVGSRYVPGGGVTNWSKVRLALSRWGNRYARFMLGLELHDATSGYRAYRKDLLGDLISRPIASDGYGFQIELVMRADRLGYTLAEVPITFREREHGHSKISRRIVVEALWSVTKWGFAMRFGHDTLPPKA